MAAKEPTVERRHRELAVELAVGHVPLSDEARQWVEDGKGEWVFSRTARALAAAEQAAAERAWDEGYDEALMRPRGTVNPYRKGDE